jgi:hypothetical protein
MNPEEYEQHHQARDPKAQSRAALPEPSRAESACKKKEW